MTSAVAHMHASRALEEYYQDHLDMRRTVVRELVLKAVCYVPQPFVAEDVLSYCAADRVSQASVYNSLSLFQKIGIVSPLPRQYKEMRTSYVLTVSAS